MKKTVFSYLRERLGIILLFLGVLGIFLTLTILYSLPMETFLYGAVLCCILLFSYLWAGFIPYHKHHKALETALASLENGWRELPPLEVCQSRIITK